MVNRARPRSTPFPTFTAGDAEAGKSVESAESDLTVGVEALLVAGNDAAFRAFVDDLFAAASSMQAVRRALGKATELSGSGVAVLLAVRRLSADGTIGIRALAEHLNVAGPHITTEIGKLVDEGLVSKLADPRDSRAVAITLTAAGRRALARLTPHVRVTNDILFAGMTADEMAHVHRFLRRIVARSGHAVERLAPPETVGKIRPRRKSGAV